jgi:hypothetical protein
MASNLANSTMSSKQLIMTKILPTTTAPDGFSLISNFLTIKEQNELLREISALEYQEASFSIGFRYVAIEI